MTPERWQRVQDLFHAMLELPAESRAASLIAACGDDIELQPEVQRLLQADAHASVFVSGAAAELERVAAMVVPDGVHIGAYRIVGELGRGGMGRVYLGERADAQFEMRVAIKVSASCRSSRLTSAAPIPSPFGAPATLGGDAIPARD